MANSSFLQSVQEGDTWPELVKPPVTAEQCARYCGASGDFNHLHYSEKAAKAAGFSDVIVQGALVMGIMGQAITDVVPNRLLRQFKVRFAKVTRLGDQITVRGRVTKIELVDGERVLFATLEATDQNGEKKASGEFQLSLAG